MRNRSDKWIEIASSGEFTVESVAVINGTTYDKITAPVITRGLFSGGALSVGNCVSSQLTFTVMTNDDIPRAAEVSIRFRLADETDTTEWMSIGPFWINKRTVNEELITLECYDAMLKGNQPFLDDNTTLNWPKDMRTIVRRCASLMGVTLDDGTIDLIKTTEDYVVTKPDAKTPILTILGNIGAVHGGNWIITDAGKLRLVKLVNAPFVPETWKNESGEAITDEASQEMVFQYVIDDSTDSENVVHVPVVIDELTTGKPMHISRVTMEMDSEIGWTYGDSDGYEILIANNPYVTEAMCDELWHELNGLMYQPYTVRNAIYDPASELGDYFIVSDRFGSVLVQETRTFDIGFSADAEAPGEEEIDNEYGYNDTISQIQSENERLYKYAQNMGRELDSKIEQTRQSIELSVQETYATKDSTVSSEQMLYYKSSSPTQLLDGTWSFTAPQWEEGWYTWTKIRYLKGDGTFTESDPLCAAGNPGLAGEPGKDGSVFHIKYSPVENPTAADMTETPSAYIGTYVDQIPTDSTDPTKYQWSRFQGLNGKDGTPGKDGKDGTTYYFHIKYSDDGGNTFTADDGEVVGVFIGTLVDTTQADSMVPSDYTWAKFQGQDGTSVSILGSYDTYLELVNAHPTGESGDGYLVDGDLYVWDGENNKWVDVGTIRGPQGKDAESPLYLYITSDSSTMAPYDTPSTVTLTACVGRGSDGDIDPNGTTYNYSWYVTKDNGIEEFYGTGKNVTITVDSSFCDDRASMRFALTDSNYIKMTDHNGEVITDESRNALEVA